ncbi:FG-GAP repeat domain-containing protein [Tsukamurella pseudospumae]|nr:VCBS repeat-containing protein [Tsukamurella pseudospumae]
MTTLRTVSADRDDIIITTQSGWGVIGFDGRNLDAPYFARNGSRIGDWLLGSTECVVRARADLDGDGIGEVLLSSPWGLGVLKARGRQMTSIAMAQNGSRVGGWVVNTATDTIQGSGDINGDGREELLVTSDWGLGLLSFNGRLTTLMLAPNGTRFGQWLLNTADNNFVAIADFTGAGRAQVLVTSPWGLAVLGWIGGALTTVTAIPNGIDLGGWRLDTTQDRIECVAYFDGRGVARILVNNQRGLAILGVDGSTLKAIAVVDDGADLGGWALDCHDNQLSLAADFYGYGRSDLLITGKSGIAIAGIDSGTLRTSVVVSNGTRLGQWLLNTRDNRFAIADLDGDGHDEIFVSSPWGVGVLARAGMNFESRATHPNGNALGAWTTSTSDADFIATPQTATAIILWHQHWHSAVDNTAAVLRTRGYKTIVTQSEDFGLTALRRVALTCRPSDRVFVYLATHGASARAYSDTGTEACDTHSILVGLPATDDPKGLGTEAWVDYGELRRIFERIAASGSELSVFDGSCTGGEASLAAIGQRYSALSTVAVFSPGATFTPDPSVLMNATARPASFGLWWSRQKVASLMTAQVPHRFPQKIYRNDETQINRASLFYRSAIDLYETIAGPWFFEDGRCELFKYVYGDKWSAFDHSKQAEFTVPLEQYLSNRLAPMTDLEPTIDDLRAVLTDTSIVARAAEVYAEFFPSSWQTMFGDLTWNIKTEPVRVSPWGTPIEPGRFTGTDGFHRLVRAVITGIDSLKTLCDEQIQLLRQLDVRVTPSIIHTQTVPISDPNTTRAASVLSQIEFSRAAEFEMQHIKSILRGMPRDLAGTPDYTRLVDALGELVSTEHVSLGTKDLAARIYAIQIASIPVKDHLLYELTIVEEAVSRATSRQTEPGDLVRF